MALFFVAIVSLKGERKKFLKNCQLTFYAVAFGQRTSVSITELVFREKHEFYFFSRTSEYSEDLNMAGFSICER